MKILHVNKFLYRRGGAEAYMDDVASLQKQGGHEVEFFGMQHPQNEPRTYERFFPSYIEFNPLPHSPFAKIKAFGRMFWSRSAAKGMEKVIEDFKPDIVHLHNIYHQLSPSILKPLAAKKIPAVMTLHDYKLACPTYQFFTHGKVCEACMGRKFYWAALKRCKDGSFFSSTAAMIELSFHTFFGAYQPIRLFLCPSRFLASKMKQARVFPDRLRVLNNFVDAKEIQPKEKPGGNVIYAGRLSYEKGIDTLIEAFASINENIRLEIAGDGPERERLERLAQAKAPGRIVFHGRLSKSELLDFVRNAIVAVLPARWQENQPISVLEAFACGVPVISSNLGGLPELVESGITGETVPPNNSEALAEAIRKIVHNPDAAFEMGKRARERVLQEFSPEVHLKKLHAFYDEAMRCAHS